MEHRTILVVDDDEDIAYMMATMLNILGYPSHHVRSGKDAVTYCVASPPAMVLLDLDMPGLDGFDTLTLLRGFSAFADMPIIAFSGKGDPAIRARTRNAGFCGHLQKPVPMDILVSVIERHMTAESPG